MARNGAQRVIGLDIQDSVLEVARKAADDAGVANVCTFAKSIDEPVDVIVSVDSFEHFDDPAAILSAMDCLLRDNGFVMVSFGQSWYHPRGGHLFSVFPWSHLIFAEKAQIRWRSDFKTDGATRFSEVAGGLNQMSIARFERLVAQSPFRFESFRTIPIRPLAWAHNRLTREFTTAALECKLVKRRHG
jgi:SAM-dependent methyltransferase